MHPITHTVSHSTLVAIYWQQQQQWVVLVVLVALLLAVALLCIRMSS